MFEIFASAALLALLLDALLGWPPALYARLGHPVNMFARLIHWAEAKWNLPTISPLRRRLAGWLLVGLLVGGVGGFCLMLQLVLVQSLGELAWVVLGLLAWAGLAQRSLHDHVAAVAKAMAQGDLSLSQQAVGMIVGRDTTVLDAAGVGRAAVESLAESFCDAVVAPLFWLLVAGLPGLWVYKAMNTADSLIGHKEPRWRQFGFAAARTDDVLNWVPARLAAIFLWSAGLFSRSHRPDATGPSAWAVMWRDCRKHASPNAGWPEAAMAGVLGVKLAGPAIYDGQTYAKPWIGEGRAEVQAADIQTALRIFRRACLLLWLSLLLGLSVGGMI